MEVPSLKPIKACPLRIMFISLNANSQQLTSQNYHCLPIHISESPTTRHSCHSLLIQKPILSYHPPKGQYYCSIISHHLAMIIFTPTTATVMFKRLSYGLTDTCLREALMVRHAESEFNKYVHIPPSALEEPLRSNLHHNVRLIDCSLSKEGVLQAQRTHLPSAYVQHNRKIDILFVSPLTRALETAQLLIKANRLEVKHVIVLPELAEVLSKICDLSSPIQHKRRRFRSFDFTEMERFVLEKRDQIKNEEEWQDAQVDAEYREDILKKEIYGLRYMAILRKIFPVPLENSDRCFDRSLRALQLMKHRSVRLQAERILVVSHNRVLKYLDGRFARANATSFENCEMRKLTF